jgi:hypothetical protein
MSIVIVNQMQNGNQELYDRVTSRVMPDDQLPDGCRTHIAGPAEGGWRVITVWDSEQQFNRFRDDKLIPALQEAGAGEAVAPQIQPEPVHKHLTS